MTAFTIQIIGDVQMRTEPAALIRLVRVKVNNFDWNSNIDFSRLHVTDGTMHIGDENFTVPSR